MQRATKTTHSVSENHTHSECYYIQQTEQAAHTTNFRLNAQSKIEINILHKKHRGKKIAANFVFRQIEIQHTTTQFYFNIFFGWR